MRSKDYKQLITWIVSSKLKAAYPGLKLKQLRPISADIARDIHGRLYTVKPINEEKLSIFENTG